MGFGGGIDINGDWFIPFLQVLYASSSSPNVLVRLPLHSPSVMQAEPNNAQRQQRCLASNVFHIFFR
jgi:hypothetical protein